MPRLRWSPLLFLLTVSAVPLLLLSFAAASEQPSARVTIPGNVAPALQDATYMNHSDPNAVLTIVVGLKRHNEAEFTDLLDRLYDADSPDYHRWITPTDFLAKFSPSQADVEAVRQHLESHGLTVKRVSDNRVLVQATGTVAQIEEAFAININVYQLGAETHYSNDRNPSVPSSLKDVAESVTGLSSLETMHHASNFQPSPAAVVVYTPWEIATIYNFPSLVNEYHGKTTYDGTGVTIAIATAYTYLTSDVDYFWSSYYQIDRTGTLTNICVNGCTSQLDIEPTLDVEYAGAQAPGANLLVYETPSSSFSDFSLMYSQMASDDSAQAVSISWGNCESVSGTSVMKTEDASFAQMAAEGMTIFTGSGDDGAYGYLYGTPCDAKKPHLQVGFPASDPNVTAVGGTTLNATAQHRYKSESAWTDSGGGTSSYFAKPSWQVGPGVPTNTKRYIPDIAIFSADCTNSVYSTYYEGEWNDGCGTSYGGPNMAGYWALVLEALKGKPPGNVAPLFYKLGASSSYKTDMHDVTTGNNGAGIGPGYNATKDWDYTTGWGSINGTSALAYFEAHRNGGIYTQDIPRALR
jgi:subtilase family serine protease